jgi:hypothetical protein
MYILVEPLKKRRTIVRRTSNVMNMFKLAIGIFSLNVRIIKKFKGRAMNLTLIDESESNEFQ